MLRVLTSNSDGIFHNSKIKYYPDGHYKQTIASRKVYKDSGWEAKERYAKDPKPKDMTNDSRSDSVQRAKNSIEDIGRLNRFDYFVTLTFAPDKVNRYSPNDVLNKVKVFLSNLVQRNNASYLFVPELHKDGAVHLHGFLSGDVKLVDSGTVKVSGRPPIKISTAKREGIPETKWKVVYNLKQWTYGYSTAIKISDDSDRIKSSKYMTKYIEKDIKKIFGKFYLAGGKSIERKAPSILLDVNYDNAESQGEPYFCESISTYFKFFDSFKFVPEPEMNFSDYDEVYI